jgi:hypothetical protein
VSPHGRHEARATPPVVSVTAWGDPAVEANGYRPGHPYLEAADLARSLGLSERLGPSAPLSRALSRRVAFGAARRPDDAVVAVRLALPELSAGQLRRLAPSALVAHERLSRARALVGKVPAEGPDRGLVRLSP